MIRPERIHLQISRIFSAEYFRNVNHIILLNLGGFIVLLHEVLDSILSCHPLLDVGQHFCLAREHKFVHDVIGDEIGLHVEHLVREQLVLHANVHDVRLFNVENALVEVVTDQPARLLPLQVNAHLWL